MRLIDADAYIDEINKRIKEAYSWYDEVSTEEMKVRAEQAIATFCEASLTAKKMPSAEPRCIANIHLSQEQLDEAFEKVKADILSVKPKTGKWIGGELGNCSVCGHTGCASDIWDRCQEHFCPNCGARLEV